MKLSLVTLILLTSNSLFAQVSVPTSYTAGIRFGSAIVQELLASPPLPSLDADSKRHISVELGYATGKVDSQGQVNGDFGYTGEPKAYSFGIGFTGKSRGKLSFFSFATMMRGTTDTDVDAGEAYDITYQDTKLDVIGLGAGANYVFLGSLSTDVAVGVFGGGLIIDTKHHAFHTTTQVGGSSEIIDTRSRHQGPILGLQLKWKIKKLSLNPYYMQYFDASDKCVSVAYVAERYPCVEKIQNSFSAAGLGIGLGKLKFTALTKVTTNIEISDQKLDVYQLGYTFDF